MKEKGIDIRTPHQIIANAIPRQGNFPNNAKFPLLIYRDVLKFEDKPEDKIKALLKSNHWINAWINGIYDFDHYHSNTHEVLVIVAGSATVRIGGPNGNHYQLKRGDVIIHPAGVSHCRLDSSHDFTTIGAYPLDIDYDMNYGKKTELTAAQQQIAQVGVPSADPIFGKDGPLFDYWQDE